MTTTTPLLPGVDRHGSGYRVRVRFGGTRHIVTGIATPEAANKLAMQLQELREHGLQPERHQPEQTLKQACESLLVRKNVSGKRRKLEARGLEFWARSLKPWIEGEYAEWPLSLLRRAPLEDAILARAANHPTSARNERQGLIAALEYAGDRGQEFDRAILGIPPVVVVPREQIALSAAELQFFVRHGPPEYAKPMLLFKGTVGNRIGELFSLVDERIDLGAATIFVPKALCKEKRDKTIPLTAAEVSLLRHNRISRAPGAETTFPTQTGKPWRYNQFWKLVWAKAIERSAQAWRDEHELAEDAPTPFDRLRPNNLRATAATLMRDAGYTREETAARIGHADTGQLLERVYDKGDRYDRARKAVAEHSPKGLLEAFGEPPQRSTTSAAAGGSPTGEAT